MIIIEQLKEEHQAILLMLEVMEAVCKKLEAMEDVSIDDLNDMVKFIKEFADKSHHLKEEDLLFPAMEEAGIPREGGPIGVMLSEHTTGREYVKGLSLGIEEYARGDTNAANQIIENARNYSSLLSIIFIKKIIFFIQWQKCIYQKKNRMNYSSNLKQLIVKK